MELKLRGMISVYDEVMINSRKIKSSAEKTILELLKVEKAERHLRSIHYRMAQAKFPVVKDLDSFDFEASSVDEEQIRSLYEGSFVDNHVNLIFVGGTGTGKTHLAIAIAAKIVQERARAKFLNLVDLSNELEREKMSGNGGRTADKLVRCDLVILDELGYLPFSKTAATSCSISSQNCTNVRLSS